MFDYVQGIVVEKQAPLVVVEVQGIGYELLAPMSTCYQLSIGQGPVKLFTHWILRDGCCSLYGFLSLAERHLFRELLRVNGVGPKLALSILSTMELSVFVQCIELNETARLLKVPGVGKKTAERLVLELRDRLKTVQIPKVGSGQRLGVQLVSSAFEEAVGGLVALGFKSSEAERLVTKVFQEGMSSEELIRLALRASL